MIFNICGGDCLWCYTQFIKATRITSWALFNCFMSVKYQTCSAIVSCPSFWGPWQKGTLPCLNAHLVLERQFNMANTKSRWISYITYTKMPTSNADHDFAANMVLTTCAKPVIQKTCSVGLLGHIKSYHSTRPFTVPNIILRQTTVNETVQQSTT